jgi:hypothetical protein
MGEIHVCIIQYNHIVKDYISDRPHPYPQRYGWWINELESLGLSVNKTNEFNDLDEIRDLTEIIKQDKYLDYKTDYLSVSLP